LLGLMSGVFPKLGEQIGVDARAFGLLMAGLGLGRLPVFALAFRWGRWLHGWRVGMIAQLLAAAMVATVSLASAYAWLSLVFLSLGLTAGVNYYRGLFKSLEGEGSRGFKSGMHEASLMAGYLVGSLASGVLASRWGLRAPYVPIALLSVGLVAVQVILVRSASRAQAAAHAEAAS
jgi:predicted MFS family arabinose efflux permease